ELWQIEQRLWTGSAAEFRSRLDSGCLMAFAGAGILSGPGPILATLDAAPRWEAATFLAEHLAETDGLAVLAYEVRAHRPGGPEYHAYCTSTWCRRKEGWRLIQHQQTQVS